MDCPSSLAHAETSEASLYSAATLHRYSLPYDYAKLETTVVLPEICPYCNAPLWDPGHSSTRANIIFVCQSHMGRCGGDGRRHQAHEAVKLAVNRLVITNPVPDGCVFPRDSVIIEPPSLRQDKSRPGDL
jgi:hypothetical protein